MSIAPWACGTGIDQTRGWFYTLMVLSTALFGKPAFKSLVCNGLILAEDGKKMSKRLRNYPVSHTPLSCTHLHVNGRVILTQMQA